MSAKLLGGGLPSLLALLLALLVASLVVFSGGGSLAYADEDSAKRRDIAIAYDNSGSMIIRSDKWCGAKYSLEVIAAMLDEGDTLAVYTMESTGQKLSLSGSSPISERAAAVHNADFDCSDWTEARTAQEAYEYLLTSTADEKYLVIATDGKFDASGGLSAVKKTVEQCQAEGITVVYLAIGSDADTISSDPDNGVFVKLAASDNILSTMTEAANQIFGRDALPEDALDAGSGKLTLDVPMGQIIVFAQGENVQVGGLQTPEGETISGNQANVKYCDKPTANTKYPNFTVNDKLQGVVATYAQQMPAGEYTLDISGADSVEVYYQPYVDISIGLADDNGIEYNLQPGAENQLSAGTYDVSYSFLDPFTGEVLDSSLLYPATFSLKAESGGAVQEIVEGDKLTISSGSVTLVANAITTGGAQATQTYRGINVSPALKMLKVDASSLSASLEIADFANAQYEIQVTKDDRSPLSEAEWAALVVEIDDPSGIEWTTEKSSELGVVICKPQMVEGDEWKTQQEIFGSAGVSAKSFELDVIATAETGDSLFRGQAKESITYGPDIISSLKIIIPCLLGLLLVLFLVYKFITKPRLPRKMRPKLVYDDKEIVLRYNEGNIQNKISPFGPETVSFAISPRDDPSFMVHERFGWTSLELVAVKKEKGRRRFKLSDNTLRAMHSYKDNHGEYPEPDFAPLPRIPSKKEKRTTYFSVTSSIGFTGFGDPDYLGHKHDQSYRLRFK